MKRYLLCLATMLGLWSNGQVKEGFVVPPNPKVGLVLSGGGAKGFAHVGVLKVLDSLHVKIDYIAGTSMGAVIGSLYATGHSGREIENLILKTDFLELLKNQNARQQTSFFNKNTDKYLLKIPIIKGKIVLPSGLSAGQKNLEMLKEQYGRFADMKDFSKLPIPFLCVATNIETGKPRIFTSGDLALDVTASSAFPGLVEPVPIGDSLYVDGGVSINFPAKPLLDHGMNVIIGVNLDQGLETKKELDNLISVLNQIISFGINKETANQLKYTDINIQPMLPNTSVTSFNEKESTIQAGDDEARRYSYYLKQLPKRSDSLTISNPLSAMYKISKVAVKGQKVYHKEYILGKMGLQLPATLSYGVINSKIDQLYATGNYTLINYDLVTDNENTTLQLKVSEDPARLFIKFGLHYDEIFKTGLLTNLTVKRALFKNSIASFDFVFGDKPRYYFNYLMDNGFIPGFGLSSSFVNIDLKDADNKTYSKWNWFKNDLYLQSVWINRYAIGFGLSYNDILETTSVGRKTSEFFSPFFFIKSDTRDKLEFPTKGIFINIQAKSPDLFLKENSGKRAIQISADTNFNFSFSDRVTYRLSGYGGISIGNVPDLFQYRLGGIFEQDLPNFVSFGGYRFAQEFNTNILRISNDLQYRIFRNYYLIANFSTASLFNDLKNSGFLNFNNNSVGLTAGYSSPFGQIKINYSQALTNNRSGIVNVILGHWF